MTATGRLAAVLSAIEDARIEAKAKVANPTRVGLNTPRERRLVQRELEAELLLRNLERSGYRVVER